MSRFFHPLLSLIACATRQELARQVHFLKVENRILGARLPQRIVVRPDERKKLIKAAKGVGKAIRELTSIVSPKTFLRWMNQEPNVPGKSVLKRKPGRPKTPDKIRELVVRLAKENHLPEAVSTRFTVYRTRGLVCQEVTATPGHRPSPLDGPF